MTANIVITSQQLDDMIVAIAAQIAENRDLLNQLDSALGDGDHGTSISTAFSSAAEQVKQLEDAQPADILKTTASVVMNRMGGASGALFGTLFMKAALTAKDKTTLTKSDMDALWQAGLDGVKSRGKSDVGDKTMIDALSPAVQAFCGAQDFGSGWQSAAEAAQRGAKSTKTMIAKHGRAKFISERAIGHQDAGATSITLMFEAIYAYWKTLEGQD
ncbi:MAG: dihydroxyacetone kinase subunit DhaL [Aggregatilineales bacterium]